MGGPLVNSCSCFNLRTGTLVTLWLCLVVSFIGRIPLLIIVALYVYDPRDLTMIISVFFYEILPYLVFVLMPFALGLYGTIQRKPKFLMVAILDIFVLTGYILSDFQLEKAYYDRRISYFVVLLILWCFGLVWYSYFSELTKSRRTRSEPLNSV